MKKVILIIITLLFVTANPAWAAKKRVWTAGASSTTSGGVSKPSVSAKLTGWKQYLNLSFRGVALTNGISYELTYTGSGNEQGVFGEVKPSEGNTSRSLFFGTCSHNVCNAHTNISNIRLTITYKMKDGSNVVKKYKVKY